MPWCSLIAIPSRPSFSSSTQAAIWSRWVLTARDPARNAQLQVEAFSSLTLNLSMFSAPAVQSNTMIRIVYLRKYFLISGCLLCVSLLSGAIERNVFMKKAFMAIVGGAVGWRGSRPPQEAGTALPAMPPTCTASRMKGSSPWRAFCRRRSTCSSSCLRTAPTRFASAWRRIPAAGRPYAIGPGGRGAVPHRGACGHGAGLKRSAPRRSPPRRAPASPVEHRDRPDFETLALARSRQ